VVQNLRVALTQTRNAYQNMPADLSDLSSLAPMLADLRDANISHHIELLAEGSNAGVQIMGFGELFPGPYFALGRDPLWFGLAEDPLTGPTVSRLREAAIKHNMVVVAPIYEVDKSTQKRFNTAVFIEANGEILGIYRKTHIPEGSNEQASFCETYYYEKSDGELGNWPKNISKNPFFPVYESSVGRIAAAICYDRHFGGAMTSLASQGAELIFSPAVTFGEKSRRMWETEFEVDACRNRVFIGGSNRIGTETPWTQDYFGASYWVGPNGRCQNLSEHPNLIISDVDLDHLRDSDPSGWNFERDLRPDIYDQ
jgi:beta-ureidopropionase